MKKFLVLLLGIVFAISFSSCERIDAGHEGILVNLYGSDRGVDDVNLVTGWVFYNPLTKDVFEYPTFVQTIDYEPFTINAKDGSEFTVDPNVNLKIIDGQSPYVFKKYRKSVKEIIEGPILKHVKDACRIEINKFTTDEIVSNREAVENAIEERLSTSLKTEGFELDPGNGFTSGLIYPQSIVAAVDAKNKAVQDGQRAENELRVAEAEARKLVVAAEAEAEANRLRQQALTPQVLQQMWIEKWDGHLPTVSGGGANGGMIVDLSGLKH